LAGGNADLHVGYCEDADEDVGVPDSGRSRRENSWGSIHRPFLESKMLEHRLDPG
jgi:hypothetical protein